MKSKEDVEHCIKQVKILRNNSVYRISDLVFRRGVRWERDRETILTQDKYRNSILYNYLCNMRTENDFRALKQSADKFVENSRVTVPGERDLVVHMRLGDIADIAHRYQKARKVYRDLYGKVRINLDDFDRVIVVTALHFGANNLVNKFHYSEKAENKSLNMLRTFLLYNISIGKEVSVLSNENPDLDFAFMVQSKLFVKGQTGMSDLVAQCGSDEMLCFDAKFDGQFAKFRSWLKYSNPLISSGNTSKF